MSVEMDELRRLETCAAGSYEVGELVARGGLGGHPPIPRVNLTSNLLSYPSTIHSVHVCRRADDAAPLAVKVVSLSSKADGGGTMVISAGSASRIAAEVRALRALDGTGGSIPTDDDDDDAVDASRSLFPRFHDFYLAPSSSPVGGWDAHLVSSMCPGARDLRAYLHAARDRGRCGLPESQARFYLAELAAALHAVHTVARLAHGDVKPENVAVSSATGHISLVDFDLSTDLGDRGVQRVGSPAMDENCQKVGTRVVVAGTEAYMSPELIAGDPRDAASDWWAFAVVAYELVHGRVPFGSPKSRHPFSSRAHVASARVHFPAADEGGPDPALSEDMKGMIVAMTRRPASGVWDRLGGWVELAHCGCFEGLTRVPRVAVPREGCWVTLPGDEWAT